MTRTIEPLATVPHTECVAPPASSRLNVYCRDCDKAVAGGSVVVDPPELDQWIADHELLRRAINECAAIAERVAIRVQRNVIFCDHCHHLVIWFSVPAGCGEFSGFVLGSVCPVVIRDRRRIAAFLGKHPEAKGVEQR